MKLILYILLCTGSLWAVDPFLIQEEVLHSEITWESIEKKTATESDFSQEEQGILAVISIKPQANKRDGQRRVIEIIVKNEKHSDIFVFMDIENSASIKLIGPNGVSASIPMRIQMPDNFYPLKWLRKKQGQGSHSVVDSFKTLISIEVNTPNQSIYEQIEVSLNIRGFVRDDGREFSVYRSSRLLLKEP